MEVLLCTVVTNLTGNPIVEEVASRSHYTLTPRAPATTGAFYFVNHPQRASISLQYLAPSPTTTANLEPLFPPQSIPNISTHSEARHLYSFFSTDTFISPTQLPNTSLPVAITNAIGVSKSHCYLMPILWDLIEATIKCKRQLLLPWRYSLLFTPAASTGPH